MTQRARVAVHELADVLCREERRRGDGTGQGAARLAPRLPAVLPAHPHPTPPVRFLPGTLSTSSGGLSPPPSQTPATRDRVCFPLNWPHASSLEGQGCVLTAPRSVMRNRLCIERTYGRKWASLGSVAGKAGWQVPRKGLGSHRGPQSTR